MMRRVLVFCGLSLFAVNVVSAATLKEWNVYPASIELHTLRDYQSVVGQAVFDDGVTRDISAELKLSVDAPGLVALKGTRLSPVADGETTLLVRYKGKTQKVPVTVTDAGVERPISFRLDVMPVFTRAGCNVGSCHGSARGKDAFMLSLFGYDPEGDYFRITREFSGRRINTAVPEKSMLIEKGLGLVQHTGGELFTKDSPLYQSLVRWLDSGAPNDRKDIATPVSLEMYPSTGVLQGKDAAQQVMVRAVYSDGTNRDVTELANFYSSDEASLSVSESGRLTVGQRGEAFVIARLATLTTGASYIVIPDDAPLIGILPANNYVDTHINNKLRALRINPSPLCSDDVFLRRVYIDIVGQLPSEEEHAEFVASQDPDKRLALIDELLGRKEFVEFWVMKWSELLQIRSNGNTFSYKSALLYYSWLQEKIGGGIPINQIVRELLSANGGTFKNPATNYYQIEEDTLKRAENVAQVFMGTRIQCAQCHNHPFDRWTMDDYYGFAAFFSQVGLKKAEDPRERIVYDKRRGDVKHPVHKRVVEPRFLGGALADVKKRDRRDVLAEWLTSPDNSYFSRNIVNIIWANYLGRGIVHEPDDVRLSNPPANPELLNALAEKLVEYDYDFKKIVRDICSSRTYQLSTQTLPTNALDERNFSHAKVRRIRAEVLLDCITQVTQTQNKFAGLPKGARAVQIADGKTSNYFLTTFGRATRETVCSCEVTMEPNLSQALLLLNGADVHGKIKTGGVVNALLKADPTGADVIESLYLRCLSRKPNGEERERLNALIDSAETRKEGLEDVFWSLLNSKEFIFTH